MLLFAAYLAVLLRMTVFREGCFGHGLLSGRLQLMPGVAYRRLLGWRSYGRAAYLFFGNIACFMPLGFGLAHKKWNFSACALAGLLLSLVIEGGQFVLGSGLSETDDLILNTLGAMAGYGVYQIFLKVKKACER
ncbi:MAG: VanZ family protein [Clostridia bacterium]|nr:VanZ family protein [Clostridia bacterium]